MAEEFTGTGAEISSSGGMTLTQMLDMRETYLLRADQETAPVRDTDLLNQAQERLLTLLKPGICTDLDKSDLSQALGSSGEYALSSLSFTPWHGAFGLTIKHTDGNFCHRISWREYMLDTDWAKTYSADYPAYYVRGGYIYVLPYDGYTIDVYYMEELTLMADGDTTTNCQLDAMFHEIIVGLSMEDFVDLHPSIARFYDRMIKRINELNDTHHTTDSTLDGSLRSQSTGGSRWGFMRH